MRHLKVYENFEQIDAIDNFCKENSIKDYHINDDGSVNVVRHGVYLDNKKLKRIPIKFNRVWCFFCNKNRLNSLDGSPDFVVNSFDCSYNKNLTTLVGGPKHVGKNYSCYKCCLKDLYGFPEAFNGSLIIQERIGYGIDYNDNPVCEILDLFKIKNSNWRQPKLMRFIYWLNEYKVIRNQDTIVRDRLEEALAGFDIELKRFEFKNYKVI